jgi:preprotein translocase subunit SecG
MLQTALLIVLVIVSLAVIGLILVQQGKGADIGAAFGSGASNSVFGSQGSGNFLTRATSILVTIFFICCLALAWHSNNVARKPAIDFSGGVELKEVPVGDVPLAPASGDSKAGDAPAGDVPAAAPAQEAATIETNAPAEPVVK